MDWSSLVAEIHQTRHIHIDKADPILAVAALNERIFEAFSAEIRETVSAAAIQFAAVGVANEASAKRLATEVVNGAAVYLGDSFKIAAREATAQMMAEVRREMAAATVGRVAHPGYPPWVWAAVAGGLVTSGAIGALIAAAVINTGLLGM